jgi:hypothetical protein
MSIFDKLGKKKKSGGGPKPRTLISQSQTLSKKPVLSQQAPKVSSGSLTAIKTALLPYKEAVVDDVLSLLRLDNKSKQNRMDYEAFMNNHFKNKK